VDRLVAGAPWLALCGLLSIFTLLLVLFTCHTFDAARPFKSSSLRVLID
jgi:hypothetical protein